MDITSSAKVRRDHDLGISYNNFIQSAGLKDGPSHCEKLPTIMYTTLDSVAQDPNAIIEIDISNAFNVLCRQTRYLSLEKK